MPVNHGWSSKAFPLTYLSTKYTLSCQPQNYGLWRFPRSWRQIKITQTLITKYPVLVVTFQPSTDVREVLQIKKVCHCIIRWQKYKNTEPVHQCFNYQSFGIHPTSVVSPQSVSSAINHMQCRNAKKTHSHTSKMHQLRRNPPAQFYRLSFTSTTQHLTSMASAPSKADNTCFSVQASSLSSFQTANISTPTT